jgi:hypothetical protein
MMTDLQNKRSQYLRFKTPCIFRPLSYMEPDENHSCRTPLRDLTNQINEGKYVREYLYLYVCMNFSTTDD